MIHEHENSRFGNSKEVSAILSKINYLIQMAPSKESIALFPKQYKALYESLSEEEKRITRPLKYRGRTLYSQKE